MPHDHAVGTFCLFKLSQSAHKDCAGSGSVVKGGPDTFKNGGGWICSFLAGPGGLVSLDLDLGGLLSLGAALGPRCPALMLRVRAIVGALSELEAVTGGRAVLDLRLPPSAFKAAGCSQDKQALFRRGGRCYYNVV